MRDERDDPGFPNDWLRRAKSNLIRAKQAKLAEVFWEDLCFDAQQAAEKSLQVLPLPVAAEAAEAASSTQQAPSSVGSK